MVRACSARFPFPTLDVNCSQFLFSIILGVLAVTRALGDSSMKQVVVGSPYTTETTLGVDDEWLIVACDGVRSFFIFRLRSIPLLNSNILSILDV